ncbi:MAG: isopeptide-forming domain-containing fimbrial protein [Oscillospiraceae bacterium]|nr:isopeptide-forming domain-containing fimbrial protein [Oscillospiraceae bacterium]
MKKILALVLALMMVMGLATTAFAADVTVTIQDNSAYTGNRSYEAYKLMTASVSAGGNEFAYEVGTKYEEVLETALGLTSAATSADIVAALGAIADRSEAMHHFSDELYRLIRAAGLAPDDHWDGKTRTMTQAYWLIVDVTDLNGTEFANSLVIVDTIGNTDITITNKPKSTTSYKHVDDENDSLAYPKTGHEDATNWQDVADYDIGDKVPFTIGITCANDIAEYDYFSFVMQDKVEKGLTFNEDSFKLYVKGVEQSAGTLAKKGSAGEAAAKFLYEIDTVTGADGKQVSQTLYVYPNFPYTPSGGTTIEANKVNGGNFLKYFPDGTNHAEINSATVRLDYTCTLNENAVVGNPGNPNNYTLKFSNNPYDYTSYGKTPDDTTIVFTYKFIVNKVDTNGNPLSGAKFTLYKFRAEGIGTMTDAEAEAAGFIHHANADTWGKFHEVNTVTVNATGDVFSFNGLDDGFYKLVETDHPAGYNPIKEPIEFSIVANHVTEIGGGAVLTALNGTSAIGGELIFSSNLDEGSLTTDIENHTGSELPSTGGMGTTLFYVLGSIMVLGATVLLITKRRMDV